MTSDTDRERVIDRLVWCRLADDPAYRNAESAEAQADREAEITAQVEIAYDAKQRSLSVPPPDHFGEYPPCGHCGHPVNWHSDIDSACPDDDGPHPESHAVWTDIDGVCRHCGQCDDYHSDIDGACSGDDGPHPESREVVLRAAFKHWLTTTD